ncbi:ubiquitin-conjugating enzyme/RWD-like protein, partial [Immersiella caudata]
YRGGLFWLNITFPNDYPWEPPRIRFETKIFHTNINNNGGISLNLLRSKKGDYTHESEWSPAYTIQKCLIVIRGLLQDPNEGFPEATHLFKTDRTRYYATVEGFTRKYAMGFDGAEG